MIPYQQLRADIVLFQIFI